MKIRLDIFKFSRHTLFKLVYGGFMKIRIISDLHLDVNKDRGKNMLSKLSKEVMRVERAGYFPALTGNKVWLV